METTALTMFNSTVKYDGAEIYIKPFCDFFGINYENQCRVITNDPLLKKWSIKKSNSLLFGDNYKRVLVTKNGFIRWIYQLNSKIVQEDLREKLIQYQELIFEYLFGSVQREEKARINYARLNKLKRLKGIISAEISRCENDIQGYLQNKFVQTRLEI